MTFTFAHLADCHLGSWRDPKLRQLGIDSFCKAMDICKERHVDFIIIAGDLFNTALPSIDILRVAIAKMHEIKQAGIPIYFIAGSHDYSPAGKTMLHILADTQIAKNVLNGEVVDGKLHLSFTTDQKTGVKLTGILGRANSLETQFYKALERSHLESASGFKIFVFHTAITELKPQDLADVESPSLSYLPKGFDYYAGGHVHYRFNEVIDGYGRIVYPGPTFPNSFAELEELQHGSFVINTVTDGTITSEYIFLDIKRTQHLIVDVNGLDAQRACDQIKQRIQQADCKDKIVTLRIKGKLVSGSQQELKLDDIANNAITSGAFSILKNTHKLTTPEFEEITLDTNDVPNMEERIITEHLGQHKLSGLDELAVTKQLLQSLNTTRADGETVKDFEKRLTSAARKILQIRE